MAKKIEKVISFDSTASKPKHAIALIYDIGGFSKFFNHPDVHFYIPKFLNHLSRAMSFIFFGGPPYWWPYDEDGDKDVLKPLEPPVHEKFLGDGALYIWTTPRSTIDFSNNFISALTNRLWILKNNFNIVISEAIKEIPIVELPKKIRFGIARGTVYELTTKAPKKKEYIGFCINLASRLQKYCPELGFIASARIGLPEKILLQCGYIKVIATKIKGFPEEIVIIDKYEHDQLEPEIKELLFKPLDHQK